MTSRMTRLRDHKAEDRGAERTPAGSNVTTERRLFIRGLILSCRIGVYPHERDQAQRVRVAVDLAMAEPAARFADQIAAVVSYDDIVERIRKVAGAGHVNLVETLAERIADACLADQRVAEAEVTVEKLGVVVDADSVGASIRRRR